MDQMCQRKLVLATLASKFASWARAAVLLDEGAKVI